MKPKHEHESRGCNSGIIHALPKQKSTMQATVMNQKGYKNFEYQFYLSNEKPQLLRENCEQKKL